MKRSLIRKIAVLTVCALLLVCGLSACQSSNPGDMEDAAIDENVENTESEQDTQVENKAPEKVDDTPTVEGPKEDEKEEDPKKEEPEKKPEKEESTEEEEEKEEEENSDNEDLFEDGFSDAEVIETDLDKLYAGWLKVASYNVQHYQSQSQELYDIGDEIKSIDPDIIGLQEIDMNMSRSGKEDQMKKMAEYLGYKYYYFGKSINSGGGEYGHGILSKYPIISSETIKFEAQHGEERSFEHHVINVNGQALGFYNTHLCLDGTQATQNKQLTEILNMMKKDRYAILTGDMNATPLQLSVSIDDDKFWMLNGSDVYTNTVNTHPEGTKSRSPIDNIIISTSLDFYLDDYCVGVIVNKTDWSDHNMIYSYVNFK